jgi:hypothetical protein
MIFIGKPTRAKNMLFASLSFLLSGLMFFSWATFDGIPSRAELQPASGRVSWVQNGRYGVKFGIEAVPRSFDYASKGNASGLVYDALSRSDRPVVSILYDPNNPSEPISDDVYYGVFEISVADKLLRSHADIATAWQSDQNVAVWLASFFLLGGIYLAWIALRDKRAA